MAQTVKRVLIVDDSRTMLEVLKVYLMGQGYEFETASGGAAAFDAALRNTPDLIISDLSMPDMTGLDLCSKMRETRSLKAVRFIIVTSHRDNASRRKAFAAGADGFLTKPLDADQLRALIASLFNR